MRSLAAFALLLLQAVLFELPRPAFGCPAACSCARPTYAVSCRDRQLEKIPDGLPEWTRSVDLSNNRISTVEVSPLARLRDLRKLNLARNEVAKIEHGAFGRLSRLRSLRLDHNRLTYFAAPHLHGLWRLLHLRLDANRFVSPPARLLKRYVPRLTALRIDANPLDCRLCSVVELRPLLVQSEWPEHRARCAQPDNLRQRTVFDLGRDDVTARCRGLDHVTGRAPRIVVAPSSEESTAGSRVTFTCRVEGHPQPHFAWFKDNEPEPQTEANGRSQLSESGDRFTLLEVHNDDAGVYRCVAANALGRTEAQADLRIVEVRRPLITSKPVDAAVPVGGTAQFRCEASGRPAPRIRWIRKHVFSVLIANDKKYEVRYADASRSESTLSIRNITKSDEENLIICSASSEYGSVQAGAQIRVQSPKEERQVLNAPAVRAPAQAGSTDSSHTALFNRVIEQAKKEVSRAINATVKRLRDRSLRRTAADVATLFRQPNEEAIQLSRAAEIYERAVEQVELVLRRNNLNLTGAAGQSLATRLLNDDQLGIIARLSGCQRQSEENIDCSYQVCFHKRFRSIDGVCNNWQSPRNGAALSPFHRLLPPQYENGVNEPIGWRLKKTYGGFPKPGARLASMKLLSSPYVTRSDKYSAMLMQWGQFIDHDLDFTPVDASNRRFSDGLTCNETCINEPPCFPIPIPPGDRRARNRICMGFARSSATCGSGATSILLGKPHYREQINQITSFIDASNVYGSHQLELDELRDLEYDEGKLREGMPTAAKTRLLPFNTRSPVDCQLDASQLHVPCFLAGDHRANENLGLLSMHTLWMREHNRLATRLRVYNPHWSGNRVFFEARKIVGAIMQHITYSAWLPKVLGRQAMQKMGRYRGYQENVNPAISNVFATAAFRFGHTLINPILYRLNASFAEIKEGHLPLHKAFFAPHKLVQDGGIDPVLRGLLAAGVKKVSPRQPMNTELTENLFKLAHEVALDLGALNIQRGRDHGLPSYPAWRRFCNLSVPTTFDGFRWEMPDPSVRERLRQVYGHPDNVDLFVGGVLEEPMRGALVGPTFACLISDQFQRLRDGDRFWYENKAYFTPSQVAQLQRASLARILCDNSDNMTHAPRDAFKRPSAIKDYVDCQTIPRIELGPWKECRYASDEDNRNTPFERPRRRFRRETTATEVDGEMRALRARIRQMEAQMAVLAELVKKK